MRKLLSIALGILILVGAIFVANYFIDNKKRPKPKFDKIVKTVFVKKVENIEIPIIITASGNLTSKRKIDIFSEVQGVLKSTNKEFKAGTLYQKGENILSINSEEFFANLQSQKSNYYNSVISIMPDIMFDFPNEYDKWQSYLNSFDINKTTPDLPKINSEKEKYFISGRGIITAYYNVKNLEVKLSKYNLLAPYQGILTEALVTPGSLIRVGQKLGEFIDPSIYEMEVSLSLEFADLLRIGNSVKLNNLDRTKEYVGKVVRINGKVDAASQTIKAYIDVAHKDLRDGTFLEADLEARNETNAIEISRKLMIENKKIYVVRDSVLELIEVNPVYFSANTAIIKGIENDVLILAKPTPGAYDGMKVKIFEENK